MPSTVLHSAARSDAQPRVSAEHRLELENQATSALPVFAGLWAAAVLFHYAAYPNSLIGIIPTVMMLAAVWVLFRPSSLVRFLAMVSLQVAAVAYSYPGGVSNHWLFAAFLNLAILLAAGVLVLSRRERLTPANLFLTFAPAGRAALLVLYFFAVLHKLNWDFLNPEVSCATALYTEMATAYTLPAPGWLMGMLPTMTLVAEFAIPLLLLIPRTRVAGVLLGVCFHAALATSPAHTYSDFSSTVYAGYFLFLPYDFAGSLRKDWSASAFGRWVAWQWDEGWLRHLVRAGLFLMVALIAVNWWHQAHYGPALFTRLAPSTLRTALIVVWCLYALTILAVLLRATWAVPISRNTRPLLAARPQHAALVAVPFVIVPLLLFNGLNPYFGLKTESSFSMFSNLRTEGGQTNHLFIPTETQVFDYQKDLVEVLASSDPVLQGIADDEHALLFPYSEFRNRVALKKRASVTYLRNGQRHEVARIGKDPVLAQPIPFHERKLLDFRLVDTYEEGFRCEH